MKRNAKTVDAAAFAAPTGLTATSSDPLNVELNWQGNATNAAGFAVEWTGSRKDDFVLIAITGSSHTRFRHEEVMPEVKYVYRVRPFFGEASDPVEIKLGDSAAGVTNSSDVPPPPAVSANNVPQFSLRRMATAAKAAPSRLAASLIAPTRVRLTWQDQASDEEGYFLEARVAPHSDFVVLELMPPDTTSFDTVELESNGTWQFRVRPFFYGKPSRVVETMTGKDPGNRPANPAPN